MSNNIVIMGTGYVGLVASVCLADLGHRVTAFDIDEDRIETLQSGEVPIHEPGLEDLVQTNHTADRLQFSSQFSGLLEETDVVFIAVGTPRREDGSCDLTYVMSAADMIGAEDWNDLVVVTKSTVPVGTGELIRERIQSGREERSNGQPTDAFDVVSNPEFLREGSAVRDFMNPDRIVVGANGSEAGDLVEALYDGIDAPVIRTELRTAEMIKYASNALLATKISFINEMANVSEMVGADVEKVAEAVGKDHRINENFLGAGVGYGGSCFPKDTEALVQIAGQGDYHSQILTSVIDVNRKQRLRFARKILNRLPDSEPDPRVGILGLSFKPNTDDMREAPSIDIIHELQTEGVRVRVHDPEAMDRARERIHGVEWCEDPYEVARDSTALVLLTEWDEYLDLDFDRINRALARPILFDGRNAWPMDRLLDEGFHYYGVGRGKDRRQDLIPKEDLLADSRAGSTE